MNTNIRSIALRGAGCNTPRHPHLDMHVKIGRRHYRRHEIAWRALERKCQCDCYSLSDPMPLLELFGFDGVDGRGVEEVTFFEAPSLME